MPCRRREQAFRRGQPAFTLPLLEDADSIQVALMQVLGLILGGQIEPKMAGLLLYGLQTASLNLRGMKLEPRKKEDVVVVPEWTRQTGVGDDAWCEEDFEQEEDEDDAEPSESDEVKAGVARAPSHAEARTSRPAPAEEASEAQPENVNPSPKKPPAAVIREEIQKAVRGALADGRLPVEGAFPTEVQRSASQPPAASGAARSSPSSRRAPSPKDTLVVDLDTDALALHMLQILVEAGINPTEFEGWDEMMAASEKPNGSAAAKEPAAT